MMPTPYETLVEIASRLTNIEVLADIDELADPTAASAAVEANDGALESAKRTLNQKCAVPLRYDEEFFPEHREQILHIRNLARAFRAEAIVAAASGDIHTVVRTGVSTLELANAARRGGLVLDLLLANAIQGIALESLQGIRNDLDEATRHWLLAEIVRLESEREPFDTIVTRDREWEDAVEGPDEVPSAIVEQDFIDPDDCELSLEEQQALFLVIQESLEMPTAESQKILSDLERESLAWLRNLIRGLH